MMGMGSVDMRELVKLQENLKKLEDEAKRQQFCEACANELAARLLRYVIKRTPVGNYSGISYTCETGIIHKGNKVAGKQGGTLRRGWTAGSKNVKQAIDGLKITKSGDEYTIEITNPVEYASYVEYGHVTTNRKGWVRGHFMMTISENEIRKIAPQLLEKRFAEFFGGAFNA